MKIVFVLSARVTSKYTLIYAKCIAEAANLGISPKSLSSMISPPVPLLSLMSLQLPGSEKRSFAHDTREVL